MYYILTAEAGVVNNQQAVIRYLVKGIDMIAALEKYKTRMSINPKLGRPVDIKLSAFGDDSIIN